MWKKERTKGDFAQNRNVTEIYRSGVNPTMACKGHLDKCWVSTQPITGLFPRFLRGFHGFTLIELLVVVLIIGILAAIAIPQYQKAVLKSRFSSLMPLATTLSESNEAYYLEHGTYTDDKTKLDVTTMDTNATVTLGNEENHQYVKLTRSDIKNQLTMYQKHSPNFAGETHCEALIDDTQANWLCKDSLKGTLIGNKYGYSIYSLSKETVGTLVRTYYDTNGLSLSDQDNCIANVSWGCRFSNMVNATCEALNKDGCVNSTFKKESICKGSAGSACTRNTYQSGSLCMSAGNYVCNWSAFNNSVCRGMAAYGCGQSSFSNSSICYAETQTACRGNTYDETSCCFGLFCEKETDTCSYKGIAID